MIDPFIGEIMLFAGTFQPKGWAFCNGQLLSISQNQALYSILGTTYGGDGKINFALPDLRGRIPIGVGWAPGLDKVDLGETGGLSTHGIAPTKGYLGLNYCIALEGIYPPRQ